MLWLTALVLHALRVAGILIYPRNNSDSVVVTYPRLPLTRLGGYWGSGIFLSCYCTFSLSSLLGGVVMCPVFSSPCSYKLHTQINLDTDPLGGVKILVCDTNHQGSSRIWSIEMVQDAAAGLPLKLQLFEEWGGCWLRLYIVPIYKRSHHFGGFRFL